MHSLQQPADLGSTQGTAGVLKTRKFIKLYLLMTKMHHFVWAQTI